MLPSSAGFCTLVIGLSECEIVVTHLWITESQVLSTFTIDAEFWLPISENYLFLFFIAKESEYLRVYLKKKKYCNLAAIS